MLNLKLEITLGQTRNGWTREVQDTGMGVGNAAGLKRRERKGQKGR